MRVEREPGIHWEMAAKARGSRKKICDRTRRDCRKKAQEPQKQSPIHQAGADEGCTDTFFVGAHLVCARIAVPFYLDSEAGFVARCVSSGMTLGEAMEKSLSSRTGPHRAFQLRNPSTPQPSSAPVGPARTLSSRWWAAAHLWPGPRLRASACEDFLDSNPLTHARGTPQAAALHSNLRTEFRISL